MEQSATFTCQLCRARLTLVGNLDGAIASVAEQQGSTSGSGRPLNAGGQQQVLQASVFDNANVDDSFIVLDGRRQGPGPGMAHLQQRGLEESFVMLGAASLLRPPPGAGPHGGPGHLGPSGLGPGGQQAQAGPSQQAGPSSSQQQQAAGMGQDAQGSGLQPGGGEAGLDSKLQALEALFELASTQTQVDQPLCMDCVGQLKEEIEAQISEAQAEIAAYSACVARLEAEAAGGKGRSTPATSSSGAAASASALPHGAGPGLGPGPSEEELLEEISRAEQERDRERRRAEALEGELSGVRAELASLEAASLDLDALEERYWHDVNDYGLHLRAHVDERDSLLAKIDRARQRLQLLRNTSVLNDAFKIWHDGPFGTISGFRLGRTPEVAVEWDEINAAWGQAVLLLHTMAGAAGVAFSQFRLLPMGSHPRISDKRTTYDLFGPVNKLWSANYDRAMVSFLACLRELGEHARRRDVSEGRSPPFVFPFPIDSDKVNGATVKLSLNKDARWTKALKFMLADLKVALQWCVKQELNESMPAQLQQLQPEGPQMQV